MKAWGWVAMVPILATLANAESLGDVAKRERERREKTKQGSTGTETKVIHEDDLVAAPGKDTKGTFNPSVGSQGGAKGADVPKGSPSVAPTRSSGSGASAPLTEVEGKRAAALRQLESSYKSIAGIAWDLIRAVREYNNQGCAHMAFATSRSCVALANIIDQLVRSVAASMEGAEEAARQGWLTPGDVREMRKSYRMDDSLWDHLVDLVRRHGR
jgi:hypothetical protein